MNVIDAAESIGLQAGLGEGPVWDFNRECLWCVDIVAPAVHRIEPATLHQMSWPAPARVGWILPMPDGSLVAGLADGLYEFDPGRGNFTLIAAVEPDLPGNRLNDAVLGPDGVIWFGTMDNGETDASGRFYRYDGDVRPCDIESMCITNGPAVSPDGKRLFTVDTLAREIWVHTIGEGGALSDARLFAAIAPDDGWPDGVTCDAEGGVWVGLWNGWRARRYDRDGHITDEVRFPVANVTKVALGGADGQTAFATTARKGLGDETLRDQPLAGNIFSFPVKVGAAG